MGYTLSIEPQGEKCRNERILGNFRENIYCLGPSTYFFFFFFFFSFFPFFFLSIFPVFFIFPSGVEIKDFELGLVVRVMKGLLVLSYIFFLL